MVAETDNVIKSIVYTVKAAVYISTTTVKDKAMIQFLKSLCEPFTWTYHTIYIDGFYTLEDLLREIYDMLLFSMDTCTNNCTPNKLTAIKRSLEYK